MTYWALTAAEVASRLESGAAGLSSAAAARRLAEVGPNQLRERRRLSRLDVLGRQLRSPLLLLLVFAAVASAVTGEWIDATIVLAIVVTTVGIGYSREYRAENAVAALGARLRTLTTVVRDGRAEAIPTEAVVPGDVVLLTAGSLVPADAAR